ncbi:MAG: amidohydrolase family protein [Candidatus Sericytochromatia bacterium]|nr:amidohydrolase family protein [Candidatus Sericytochromatia bacterium]
MKTFSLSVYRHITSILLLLCLIPGCAPSYAERMMQQLAADDAAPLYALTGVNVIPVQPAGVLSDQTLLVGQGRTLALGPRDTVVIPAHARQLDLTGRYVLPGFSDMHVHLAQERDLLLFLRHGITRVRNMADSSPLGKLVGFPHTPALREAIATGRKLGPQIFACGPFLDGDPPQNGITTPLSSPAAARAAVRQSAAEGFDCIKVYNRLQPEIFAAVVDEARVLGLPVMGHVPHDVGLDGALAAPMKSIEHLNAYIDNFAGTYRVPPERWTETAAATAAAGVYNCPTLVIWDQHPPSGGFEAVTRHPRYRYVPDYLRWFWQIAYPELFNVTYADKNHYLEHILQLSLPMVKALHEGGAPLLVGSDANLTGIFPGWTALREMELLARAGVPSQAVLEAATLNPARMLGQAEHSGRIAPGYAADLVVLGSNPLEDIRAVYDTVGVMTQGHWLSAQTLDQMLEADLPPVSEKAVN